MVITSLSMTNVPYGVSVLHKSLRARCCDARENASGSPSFFTEVSNLAKPDWLTYDALPRLHKRSYLVRVIADEVPVSLRLGILKHSAIQCSQTGVLAYEVVVIAAGREAELMIACSAKMVTESIQIMNAKLYASN